MKIGFHLNSRSVLRILYLVLVSLWPVVASCLQTYDFGLLIIVVGNCAEPADRNTYRIEIFGKAREPSAN